MPNTPLANHPLLGTTHTYRADLPPYDASQDTEGGTLVLGNGHTVTVMAVFTDWNDRPGLDILGVTVSETGYTTHVTPADLGLPTVHSYLVTPEVEPNPEPKPEQPVIIAYGNPVDGFTFEGPFSSRDAAIEYGDSVDTEWWVANLDAPEEK